MLNVYSLDGPRTKNNTEVWHSKLKKLARKAHPNIYEAVHLSSLRWLQLKAPGCRRSSSEGKEKVKNAREMTNDH